MRRKILNHLETVWAGKTCLCFHTLESTNDYAKELIKLGRIHGTLIVTEHQTAGRGRRGRSWQSSSGEAVTMSLCLEPEFAPEKASGLTLVMALAAAAAIQETAGVQPQIKWPNDLVINGRKICGILTELHLKKEGYAVIIGVGINVNMTEFPRELRETAGSLKLETGKDIKREELVAAVMKYFEKFYAQYQETEDFSLLKDAYEELLVNCNREVRVLDPGGAYQGTAKGINQHGSLIVLCEDGSEREIDSGEVSVRGIYGYV